MDLTERIAATVADAWLLPGATLAVHDAGMNSRTWWVDHEGVRLVAKWVPSSEAAHLQAGAEAAGLAAAGGLATGAPRPTTDGRLWVDAHGGCLVLLTRVDGTELTGADPGDAERIGATLALAHRQTVGLRTDGAWQLFWVDPTAAHLDIDLAVRAAVEDAVAAVTAIPDHALTTGLGHGDPAPEAFLRRGRDTGLIDWGSAVNGPLLHDLASAAMYLGGLDPAAPMLAAYDEADGPVPRAEVDEHAAAFLRWRWAVQADYFARRIVTGDDTGARLGDDNRSGFDDARRQLLGSG